YPILDHGDEHDMRDISGALSQEFDPRFSPDGSKIVFVSVVEYRIPFVITPQIFIMDAQAPRKITRVTFDGRFDADPSMSPDGKYIVFNGYRGEPQFPFQETGFEFHDWYIFK